MVHVELVTGKTVSVPGQDVDAMQEILAVHVPPPEAG
jgi:hypothetical protein